MAVFLSLALPRLLLAENGLNPKVCIASAAA